MVPWAWKSLSNPPNSSQILPEVVVEERDEREKERSRFNPLSNVLTGVTTWLPFPTKASTSILAPSSLPYL